MSVWTERLVQIAAVVAICYFGWQIAAQTVVDLLVTKGNLRQCQQEVLRLRAPAQGPPQAPKMP